MAERFARNADMSDCLRSSLREAGVKEKLKGLLCGVGVREWL